MNYKKLSLILDWILVIAILLLFYYDVDKTAILLIALLLGKKQLEI